MEKPESSEKSAAGLTAPVAEDASPDSRLRRGGVTWRAVLLAFLLLLLFAPAGFYGELVYGTTYTFASGVPAMGSLVALFLITAINGLVRRTGRSGLSRGEVLTTYAIVLVGGPLMTHGILAWMIGHNLAPQLVARAQPQWQTTFLMYTPWWFTPTNPDTVEAFFNGRSAVPWIEWAAPLAAWGSFAAAIFVATLCFVLLFRHQWISNERLPFPTAQIPLEFVQENETRRGPSAGLPRNAKFWIGFGVVFLIYAINAIGKFYPSFPGIPIMGKVLMNLIPVGPLAGLGEQQLNLDPTIIGIAFLIPKELSFSCWAFYFLRVAQTVAAISLGAVPHAPEDWYESSFPAPYYQGAGAAIALGFLVLWMGRRHLLRAVRLALSNRPDPQDPRSPAGYRVILLGLLLAFAYMVFFCMLAGARAWFGVIICTLLLALYVMWARLRAETGLGFLPFPLGVESMMLVPFGSTPFRPQEIVTLISLRWSYFPGFGESYEVVTGNSLEAFKIADAGKLRERRLLIAIVIGFGISLLAGLWFLMWGMYHYGFYNMNCANSGWLQSQMRVVGQRMHTMFTTPTKFDLNGTIGIFAGGAVALILGALRLRFWWWPFHPFGYLAANCWGMQGYWQGFFLGWLWKSLVIRYGGLRLYREMLPLAIGMLMGSMVGQGLHVVAGTIAKL